MTFDTHLINLAMAGIGISASVAVLIAFAIIGAFAWRKHNAATDIFRAAPPMVPEQITQSSLRQAA
jgi:hypothetical protein